MTDVKKLITEHLDIWLTAETEKKLGRGRSSGSSNSIYGVQKLRELILDLAIRGKLVTQDSNNKLVQDILLEIAEQKNNLIRDGVIKKSKPLPMISEDEKPFIIPPSWSWSRLNWIVSILGDGIHGTPIYEENTGLYFVNGNNLNNGNIIIKHETKTVSQESFNKNKKDLNLRSILVSINGTIGNVAFYNNEPIILGKSACYFNLIEPNSMAFMKIVLNSPYFYQYANKEATGSTIKNLSLASMNKFPVPLPPLEEQKSIVAKVDELMQLCDQLEKQQSLSSEVHDQLVDTLLNVLINSSDVDEFQQNWQRISENFDLLFTTEYSIEQLKQTILQLAVMGKLVKQDTNDEPASELLEKIAEKKAKLVQEGTITKKAKTYSLQIADINLPRNWSLVNINQIIWDLDAGWSPACHPYPAGSNKWGVLKTTFVQCNYFTENENKELPEELSPRVESELKSGDILVTRAGPYNRVGVACYIDNIRPKLMISDKIIRISYDKVNLFGPFIALSINFGITKNYLKDNQSGMAESQVNISQDKLRSAPILLPPLSEQKRIVEKVNQLFFMIEQLQILQGKLQRTKLHLADSLIANVLINSNDKSKPEAPDNIIQFEKPIEPIKQSKQKSADQIDLFADDSIDDDIKLLSLAAEITFQLHTESTFGHLKLQKLIYLCQQLKHMDLAADFKQHAAGPYDPVMARYLDKEFKNREWFSYDPKRDLKYKPLSRCNDHRSAFDRYFAEDVSEIYNLIGLFRTSKSDHIEIVATLFACWLRLLEQKQSITEEQLLKDFYAWSEEKKKFSKDEVLNGYKWMQQYSVIPQL